MGTGNHPQKNFVFLFELQNADSSLLNDQTLCSNLITQVTETAGLTHIKSLNHTFTPQGVSIISLLAESHIAMHTWPEFKSGYVTLTTCREPNAQFSETIQQVLRSAFGCEHVKVSRL